MKLLNYTYEQLMNKGLHIGNVKQKRNLFMNKYIFTTYNKIDIINLNYTIFALKLASNILKKTFINHGLVLTICNTNYTELLPIKDLESSLEQPIIQKNIPGIISNIQKIKTSSKYADFINTKLLNRSPNLLFVINAENKNNLITQANHYNIPSINITDTSDNPFYATITIPSNNTTLDCINFYLTFLIDLKTESYRLRINNFFKQALIYKKLPNSLYKRNKLKKKTKYQHKTSYNPRLKEIKQTLIKYQYFLTKTIITNQNTPLQNKIANTNYIRHLSNKTSKKRRK